MATGDQAVLFSLVTMCSLVG